MNEEQKQAIRTLFEEIRRDVRSTRSYGGICPFSENYFNIMRARLEALMDTPQPCDDLAMYLRKGMASGRITAEYVLEHYGGAVRCTPEVKALVRELESAHE